jgi:hypothetical protein
VDGRWTEDVVDFVGFRVAGILEIPKHERNCAEKNKKKTVRGEEKDIPDG